MRTNLLRMLAVLVALGAVAISYSEGKRVGYFDGYFAASASYSITPTSVVSVPVRPDPIVVQAQQASPWDDYLASRERDRKEREAETQRRIEHAEEMINQRDLANAIRYQNLGRR